MALPKATDHRFTYADYRQWPADERWELIDGVAYAMAPAPTISHQTLAGQLFRQIDEALDGAPRRALIAPSGGPASTRPAGASGWGVACDLSIR